MPALQAYQHIPIRLVDVDLENAMTIANQLSIYAYDAYLIACARDHKCALITLDNGLQHAARTAGVTILEV